MSRLERDFQAALIWELKELFHDCIVLKNDANYLQGFPDLLLLVGPYWFALEVKASARASIRPNQEYYVDRLNEMSYAAIIYPENKDAILNEIQRTLQTCR